MMARKLALVVVLLESCAFAANPVWGGDSEPSLRLESPRNHLLKACQARMAAEGSKPSVDLVVARYKEDLRWVAAMQAAGDADGVRVRVYDKSGEPPSLRPSTLDAEWIPTPNLGLESHSYLTHIVANYDNLAKKTVFVQGKAPSAGFNGHKAGGGHMLPGTDFAYDYMSACTPALYLPTCAVNHEESKISFREALIYADEQVIKPSDEVPQTCPPKETAPWTPWVDHGWRKSYLQPLIAEQGAPSSLSAFWETHLRESLGPAPEGYFLFAQGSMFSATDTQIRAHPKSFYENLLKLTSAKEPVETYYMETLWGYVLGAADRTTKCDAVGGDEHSRFAGHHRLLSGYAAPASPPASPPAFPPVVPMPEGHVETKQVLATVLSFTVTFVNAGDCANADFSKLAARVKCSAPKCYFKADCAAAGRRLSSGDRRRLNTVATVQMQFPDGSDVGAVAYQVGSLDANAVSQVLNAPVNAISTRQTTTQTLIFPDYASPPPSPPSPPPLCGSCKAYFNGAKAGSSYLCLKPGELSCYPVQWNGGCLNAMVKCQDASLVVPITSVHFSGTPTDKAGVWADKKCAKKLSKGKCHKKRVQRFCGLTCRGQTTQRG